jgi:cell division topological specificity factor
MRIPLLQRLFGGRPKDVSRDAARQRLKNALVGDRCSVAPGLSESMRRDLLEVLGRYMEIDAASLDVRLDSRDEQMHWSAGVKVVRVHRQAHLPEQALQAPTAPRKRLKKNLRGVRWRRSREEEAPPSIEEQSA